MGSAAWGRRLTGHRLTALANRAAVIASTQPISNTPLTITHEKFQNLGHLADDNHAVIDDHLHALLVRKIRSVRMTVTDLDLHRGFLGAGTAMTPPEAMAAFLDGADRVPGVQAIRAAMRSSLLDREAPQADIALLDAACGTGTETRVLAQALRGKRVIGLDHNQGLLEIAAARMAAAGEPASSGLS